MNTQTGRQARPAPTRAVVIAASPEVAQLLFAKIAAGELSSLYESADDAERVLDSYPWGHRRFYRVFAQN